jgi:hypothetical protein
MIAPENKKDWVRFEVVNETGLSLGWVRSVSINAESDTPILLKIISSPIWWLPEHLFSTYELIGTEITSIGSNRLLVFEGTENRLVQLTVGLLERLGLMKPIWERASYSSDDNYDIGFSSDDGDNWDDGNWSESSYSSDDNYDIGFSSDDGDDGTWLQPAIKPRRPNPKPTDDAAEIPLD